MADLQTLILEVVNSSKFFTDFCWLFIAFRTRTTCDMGATFLWGRLLWLFQRV